MIFGNFFFLLTSCVVIVKGGFVTPRNESKRITTMPVVWSQQLKPSPFLLLHAKPDKDEEQAQQENPTMKIFQRVIRSVYLLFAYAQICLGIALSFGLFLNICGYAYTFNGREGLVIDTIQTLREEQQFRKAAYSSPSDRGSKFPH